MGKRIILERNEEVCRARGKGGITVSAMDKPPQGSEENWLDKAKKEAKLYQETWEQKRQVKKDEKQGSKKMQQEVAEAKAEIKEEVKIQKRKERFIFGIVKLCLSALLVLVLFYGVYDILQPSIPTVTNAFILERIEGISDLATLQTTYNGVAQVTNPKDFTDVLYYVSYESIISVGIDFSKVTVDLDHESKHLKVTIPPSRITSNDVDIASLDYLFMDNKANTSYVAGEAYQACVDDVTIEGSQLLAVRQLATENAKNAIVALTEPFLNSLGRGYTVVVEEQ